MALTLTWNAEGDFDVSTALTDNNQMITKPSGVLTLGKFGDAYGSSLSTEWSEEKAWTENGWTHISHPWLEGGSVTESSNICDITLTGDGSDSYTKAIICDNSDSGDFEWTIKSTDAAPQARGAYSCWGLIAKADDTNHATIMNGMGSYPRFRGVKSGSTEWDEEGASLTSTSPLWLKLKRVSGSYTAYYSTNGSSYTQYGSAHTFSGGDIGAVSPGGYVACHNYSSSTHEVDLDDFTQVSGSIYYSVNPYAVAVVKGQPGLYKFSTFDATEAGTIKYDYSVDGGSTYSGTWRTKAQMQGLSDAYTNSVAFRVRMESASGQAAATCTGITMQYNLSVPVLYHQVLECMRA